MKMKNIKIIGIMLFASIINAQKIQSPSKSIEVDFNLDQAGKPNYSVQFKNKKIINQSYLGLQLKDGTDFTSGFSIENSKTGTFDETWQPVLGEEKNIRNHYNEFLVDLIQKATGKKLTIVFRVFNDGVAFRYE